MIIDNKEYYQIPTHQRYYISEYGEVYSTIKGKILKQSRNSVGYWQVWLTNNEGIARWERIHVLVCRQFNENPNNYPEVNHDDGNKDNNHKSNVEWSTRKKNMQHAHDTGLIRHVSGADHWRSGTKQSDETKKLMSKAKIGRKHPKYKGMYVTPKGNYHSAIAAGFACDVTPKTIIRRCNNARWKGLGWDFIGKEEDRIYIPL